MVETDWVSAHLHCHGELDGLLLGAVGPVAAEAMESGLARAFFFLRHWDGGSHLRLRLLAPGGADRRQVRELVRDRCGRYLREHPALASPRPEEYAAAAAHLARWEGVANVRPLEPDGAVRFIAYRREHERYGRGASMEAVERHFGESSRIALGLVGSLAMPDRRHTAAFALLLLAWLTGGAPPVRWTGLEPGGLEDRFRRQRDSLLALAGPLVAGAGPDGGALAAWRRSVAGLREGLAAARPGPPRGAAAVVDTCAHLACNRIGISLPEEAYVRALAARTLAELRPAVPQ